MARTATGKAMPLEASTPSEAEEVPGDEPLELVRKKYVVSPSPVVQAFVSRLREAHGDVRAVVLYGSRLWDSTASPTSIFDFFVFAGDYRRFYRDRRDALLNLWLAPSTYHLEVGGERCKYNVVSLSDFARATAPGARDLFVAGRFSKRVALVWAADEGAREAILRGALAAMELVVPLAVSRLGPEFTFDEFLGAALGLSYAAEIRVESDTKVARLLRAEEPFYRRVYGALLARYARSSGAIAPVPGRGTWRQEEATLPARRRRTEALLRRSRRRMYVRWFKYMATLEGWTDLLLDKVERTQGLRVELTPLQRKYPYIFGWPHFFRLLRRGLIK